MAVGHRNFGPLDAPPLGSAGMLIMYQLAAHEVWSPVKYGAVLYDVGICRGPENL